MPRQRKPASASDASAGRVIAGTARGIRLIGPGEGTRPLGDRMKQSLFAILEPALRGAGFLDLYAGSGAGGIEALSRGASRAVFVERERVAREAIERNLAAAGFSGTRAAISDAGVEAWLARTAGLASTSDPKAFEPFAVALIDPPYDRPEELVRAIEGLASAGPGRILAADGIIVVKHFWKTEIVPPPLLRSVRRERFGDTVLTFLRWADEVAA